MAVFYPSVQEIEERKKKGSRYIATKPYIVCYPFICLFLQVCVRSRRLHAELYGYGLWLMAYVLRQSPNVNTAINSGG